MMNSQELAKRRERSRTVKVRGEVSLPDANFSFINCNGKYNTMLMSGPVCMASVIEKFEKR